MSSIIIKVRPNTYLYLALFLIICLHGCNNVKKETPGTIEVQTVKIVKKDIKPTKVLEGEIVSSAKHELAFLVAGRIVHLNVKEGDRVKKGQQIAELDDSDYLEALKIAQSKLDEANDQYKRLSSMYASGSLPEADYEKIKLLRKEAQANYNLYKNKHKYTKLLAPDDGIISRVITRAGTAIDQGQPIVTLINENSVYAAVGIPELSINKINLNDSSIVIVPASGDTLIGPIYNVSPSASRVTRTYRVNVLVDNQNGKLKDGMLCQVQLHEHASRSAILLPLSIVREDASGTKYVFVVVGGVAKKRRVITGEISANSIEIEKGLDSGDLLIVNPPMNITDGLKVNY